VPGGGCSANFLLCGPAVDILSHLSGTDCSMVDPEVQALSVLFSEYGLDLLTSSPFRFPTSFLHMINPKRFELSSLEVLERRGSLSTAG